MVINAQQALQFETEFISGMELQLRGARGQLLRGSIWEQARYDESDRVRDLMAQRKLYDRDLLRRLPSNRRTALHGFEKKLIFWKRRTGVALASTLSPLAHYVEQSGEPAPPVGLGMLKDHVKKLVGDGRVPHLVGVCSPSGFTDEARSTHLGIPRVQLVLIEPDGCGGWEVTSADESVEAAVLELFDPEDSKHKMARVREYLADQRAELLTGSVSVASIAARLSLPAELVREAFERAAQEEPELRLTRYEDDWLLFRGAPVAAQGSKSMGVVERIKQLFAREGNETEKIQVLTERRAALAHRRDQIYEDITKLEVKEADLLAQGKAASSQVPRRRIAAQLSQLRKDISRQHTTAAMLNQQINIISTDVHNLTRNKKGAVAKWPSTDELTENGVRAEEMLEGLKADSELVSSLEGDMQEATMSNDELAILREFEETESAQEEPQAETEAQRRAVEPARPFEATMPEATPPAEQAKEKQPPAPPQRSEPEG